METRSTGTTLNQKFGYVFGAVYVLVGLVGFAITSGLEFFATEGKDLVFFEINPLHNVVHVAVGALLIIGASKGLGASRGVNTLVGSVYLATALLGLFLASDGGQDMNILAINQPDNVLHLATAVLALGVARMGDRNAADRTVSDTRVRA